MIRPDISAHKKQSDASLLSDQDRAIPTPKLWALAGATLGIAAVGVLDYATGTELRMTPIYYFPIAIAGWRLSRLSAMGFAGLATLTWTASNWAAGLVYAHPVIWPINMIMQALSYGAIAILMSTLRDANRRERDLSRIDGLTRLCNRRAFYDRAKDLTAASLRARTPMTVAYIDLDNFKQTNDGHGHATGDAVLRAFADLLRATLRETDVPARLGGDEFAILLPGTNPDNARTVFNRLRAELAGAPLLAQHKIGATIGVVTFATPPREIKDAVAKADALMYEAKRQQKNQTVFRAIP